MKLWICFIFFFLLCGESAFAQQEYERHVFVSSKGDSLLYRLLRPETVKPGKKYPLILFLHGAGERGNDNQKQLKHGGQMFLNPVYREKYPAYVLFPQCPSDGFWGYREYPPSFAPSDMSPEQALGSLLSMVKELLDTYRNLPEVDTKRIYIMGMSMGAMGTYSMVCCYPEIFAAAIPICGTVNPKRLSAAKGLKQIKFRIFHGDADNVVPVSGSRIAYKILKEHGAEVDYTEFVGCEHNSWNPAFNTPGFMEWLFSQKKK